MQKELTVFLICILALTADILYFQQTVNFQFSNIYDDALTVSMAVLTVCLVHFSFVLLRKIISRLSSN